MLGTCKKYRLYTRQRALCLVFNHIRQRQRNISRCSLTSFFGCCSLGGSSIPLSQENVFAFVLHGRKTHCPRATSRTCGASNADISATLAMEHFQPICRLQTENSCNAKCCMLCPASSQANCSLTSIIICHPENAALFCFFSIVFSAVTVVTMTAVRELGEAGG